ncbi:hypothetical protein [uncultured Bartonella sp.]|uniref:hypothetical protein n=1 Tax=uncultured Bartonella sp. TaxID=104108 RepID=UPI00261EA9A6|nr:hypothetical protein [uncultured Bartonella sp.]
MPQTAPVSGFSIILTRRPITMPVLKKRRMTTLPFQFLLTWRILIAPENVQLAVS